MSGDQEHTLLKTPCTAYIIREEADLETTWRRMVSADE